jgi:hypothetical protein
MKTRQATLVLVALAAAVALTSVAAAGPAAVKQRMAITMKDLPNGTFTLDPLQAGALKPDSGTTSVVYKRLKVMIRDGQSVEVFRLTFTLKGKNGTLTTQERNEWVDAGGPYVGNGTWKIVGGTGQYAGITGHGRTASAGLDRGNGDWYVREEGVLVQAR